MREDWNLGTGGLRIERDGPIAWCIIDRPHARNALTPAMYLGIKRAIRHVETSDVARALVITGTGDVFAPGGDMGGRAEHGDAPVPHGLTHELLPFATLRESNVPVVAAVNGICQAGGLLIAMMADVAVVSDRATFRVPELLRGLVDATFAATLPVHVGMATARDLMLTARTIDAAEAQRIGLVSRIVAHDDLRREATSAAIEILRTAPQARAHTKRMLNQHYPPADYHTMFSLLRGAHEPREGMRAFVEKRAPDWVPEGLSEL